MDRDSLYAAFEKMSFTEIVRLQDHLSQLVRQRFGKDLALIFTDIAGSTQYTNTFGDEAGRRLQQRHIDALEVVLEQVGGRIVDTAGDGAFAVVPGAQAAADALIRLMRDIDVQNEKLDKPHRMHLRCGLHWGQVLTNGEVVTGDDVNLAARISASAELDEIRLAKNTFKELSHLQRLLCRSLGPVDLKGIAEPVELLSLSWLDPVVFPGHVLVRETDQRIDLPSKPTIAFGRLASHDGMPANDVVLQLPDPNQALQISRWHIELRRTPRGYMCRAVSRGRTEVDGQVLEHGEERLISTGSVVTLSRVVNLVFYGGPATLGGGSRATVLGAE